MTPFEAWAKKRCQRPQIVRGSQAGLEVDCFIKYPSPMLKPRQRSRLAEAI